LKKDEGRDRMSDVVFGGSRWWWWWWKKRWWRAFFLSFLEDNKCKCVEEIYTDEEKRIIERII